MYRQFARICLAPTLGPIPEEDRHPERVALFLRKLGLFGPQPGQLEVISRLAREIQTIDAGSEREGPRWEVGDVTVSSRFQFEEAAEEVSLYHLQCRRCVYNSCHHTRALLFSFAWQDPQWRDVFATPVWEMALATTLEAIEEKQRAAEAAAEEANLKTGPRAGWLRFHLSVDDEGQAVRGTSHLRFEIDLMRLSKQTGEPLRPQSAPETWPAVEARVKGLSELDRQCFTLIRELDVMDEARRKAARSTRSASRAMRLVRARLVERIVELLVEQDDVQCEGKPVAVNPAPLEMTLGLLLDEDLWRLHLDPPLHRAWSGSPPHVVTAAGELRPIDPAEVPLVELASRGELPPVPRHDLERFLSRMSPLGITLAVTEEAELPDPDEREARLYLHESDADLIVAARLAYTLDGQAVVLELDDARNFAAADTFEGRRLFRREATWEDARRAEVAELLGESGRGTFRGEDALDVLAHRLPELADRWAVFGQDDLHRFLYLGQATPSVGFTSGMDWFDLDVSFKAGDKEIPAQRILDSWRQGERYVRLKSGALAHLPDKWLGRFGEVAWELLEMRRAAGEHLGAFAAPLMRELMDGQREPDELEKIHKEEALARLHRISDALTDFDGIPSYPLPEGILAELRPYQRRGHDWLRFLRESGLGGILADDMGLGKTLQALCAITDAIAQEGQAPSLVVAPTSVLWGWQQQARLFAPDLNVVVHHGASRATRAEELEGVDVVVTSYALLRIDAELLTPMPWLYAILDEAQHIKNPRSQTAKAARALEARHRLALTGTPVENNLVELWSIFHFLMPGFFGSLSSFRRRYANPAQRDESDDTLGALRRRIRPFVLRRLKREVAAELPPRQEVVLYCELGERQRELYERVRDTYRHTIFEEVDRHGISGATIHVLEALTRLRQACCHPGLLPFDEAEGVDASAKLDLLMETLETSIADGHRALLFSQWPSLLTYVRARVEAEGWDYLYLDGSTTERAELVEAFNDDDGPPLFMISLKAGGTGLNLTGADHVIHLDPWWNPAVEDQATDRAHRIGQDRPVTAYKLVARDTVEEKILELQERKRAIFEGAINEGRVPVGHLTREDLAAVFG